MPTLALIGDSHTQALWPRVSKALAPSGYTVVLQEAQPGWSEASFRSKKSDLPARLVDARPEVVVIELGGNAQKVGDAYAEDVRWLVSAAKDAGAQRILWYGPATSVASINQDAATRHERTAEAQKTLLPALGVEWHDSRPLTLTDQRSDGVHFTNAGYDRWAADIVASVLKPPSALARVFGGGGISRFPKAALVASTVGVSALLLVVALRLRGKI
jgi:lysophospholipase L1-like esterase